MDYGSCGIDAPFMVAHENDPYDNALADAGLVAEGAVLKR